MANIGSIRARSTNRPASAAISGHSQRVNKPKSTSATYNISSVIGGKAAPRSPSPRKREEARSAMRSWPRPRIHSHPILHGAGE